MRSSAEVHVRQIAVVLLSAGLLRGQVAGGLPVPPLPRVQPVTAWERLTADYRTPFVAPSILTDTPRLDALVTGGQLYLSLPDAIAIALENNLDVELQRYLPRIADTDLLRTSAGSLLRGLPIGIREGPAGVGSPRLFDVSTGITSAQPANISPQTPISIGAVEDLVTSLAGTPIAVTGPPVPLFDPVLTATAGWQRQSLPQVTPFLTGAQSLRMDSTPVNLGFQKGFLSGALLTSAFDSLRVNQNNLRADVNPNTTGSLGFTFTQPLLQGFGFALNRRFMRIARNNREVSELVFEQQVISTVFAVLRLYWDLVGLNQDLVVRQQTVALNQALLDQSERQEKAGALAPIEVTRARAEVARGHRDLTVAEALVRQQETILKDFLSRRMGGAALSTRVRVVTTSSFALPADDPVLPEQDLVAMALERRPEIRQARLQLDNNRIGLEGSRNGVRPSLNLVLNAQTNSLFGQPNTLPIPPDLGGGTFFRQPDPVFIGGFGTGLEQLLTARFPNYGAQLLLTIPIWNRTARADVIRDQLFVRQQEVRLRQLEKQVRVDVLNSLIALRQARAQHVAAVQQRLYQEEAVKGEEVRHRTGVSTLNSLIQFQRDLALARSSEVVALNDFVKARNALDRSTGSLLIEHNVLLDEAYRGRIQTTPTPPSAATGRFP